MSIYLLLLLCIIMIVLMKYTIMIINYKINYKIEK